MKAQIVLLLVHLQSGASQHMECRLGQVCAHAAT